MGLQKIGSVKAGKSRRSYRVYWNPSDKRVYIENGGRTDVGKADSAGEAMNVAEAALYNK